MTNEESAWFLTTFLNIVRDNSIKTINVKKIPRFEESIEKAIEALTEPKMGEWIYHKNTMSCVRWNKWECSVCHDKQEYKTDYCPSCGANMIGKKEC